MCSPGWAAIRRSPCLPAGWRLLPFGRARPERSRRVQGRRSPWLLLVTSPLSSDTERHVRHGRPAATALCCHCERSEAISHVQRDEVTSRGWACPEPSRRAQGRPSLRASRCKLSGDAPAQPFIERRGDTRDSRGRIPEVLPRVRLGSSRVAVLPNRPGRATGALGSYRSARIASAFDFRVLAMRSGLQPVNWFGNTSSPIRPS